jgi:flagellar basal-body rod protein FlgB
VSFVKVDTFGMLSANSQVGLLARLIDVAQLRHDVIAQNVANVNTPGYRRLDVDFQRAFARALAEGEVSAAPTQQPRIVIAAGGSERLDGNNVDMDVEMGQLQKNTLLYRVYTQVLAVQLAQWRSAVSGRTS